ncbi:MAG: 16S rRNA (guanine(966)-N(2))-methyltransferase RsmD [Pseudomonadota bacterium]
MRIIGGRWKGRRLDGPGEGTRPTSDRVRENLFNILANGPFRDVLTNARVLDLFSGTGALGLEALSRGAMHATFVEKSRSAAKIVERNMALVDTGDTSTLLVADATRLPRTKEAATLIFADPPYRSGLGPRALTSALSSGWAIRGTLAVVEEAGPISADGWTTRDSRAYGGTVLSFLEAEGA